MFFENNLGSKTKQHCIRNSISGNVISRSQCIFVLLFFLNGFSDMFLLHYTENGSLLAYSIEIVHITSQTMRKRLTFHFTFGSGFNGYCIV